MNLTNKDGDSASLKNGMACTGKIVIGEKTVMQYLKERLNPTELNLKKELDLSEGHASGIPTIQEELAKNGSPRAEFFTDEDRRAMRIRIPIHPAFLEEDKNLAQNETRNERSLSEVLSEVLKPSDYEKMQSIIDILERDGKILPKQAENAGDFT